MKGGQSVKCQGQIDDNVPCRLENESFECQVGICPPFWWCRCQADFDLNVACRKKRPILDLVWNLPTLVVKHVPECGILILYSFNVLSWPKYHGWLLVKVPLGDMAVQCPCFLVLNSNGWADFLSNPVLPFQCSRFGRKKGIFSRMAEKTCPKPIFSSFFFRFLQSKT